MAKWSTVIRQILLRGNFFAGDAPTIKNVYLAPTFSDAALTKNAAEYPFDAIVDAILQAMTQIIGAIGENRESNFRTAFLADTAPIISGGKIPAKSANGKPRYGLIRNVRQVPTAEELAGVENPNVFVPRELTHQPRSLVDVANRRHGRLLDNQFAYYTDDVSIWHTCPSVIAEIVAWDKESERQALINNGVSECPLPDELHPALEFGTLSFIYRDTFNAENALVNMQRFVPELLKISGKPSPDMELPKKA